MECTKLDKTVATCCPSYLMYFNLQQVYVCREVLRETTTWEI